MPSDISDYCATLSGQTTAEIIDITWLPDYPDGNVPAGAGSVTLADFTIQNTGNKDGTVYMRISTCQIGGGGGWSQGMPISISLAAGETHSNSISWNTDNFDPGQYHFAFTVWGEDETEPSLPDCGTCP